MTSGNSISLLVRDSVRGTSELYSRVAWTSVFKQFFPFYLHSQFKTLHLFNWINMKKSQNQKPFRAETSRIGHYREYPFDPSPHPHPKKLYMSFEWITMGIWALGKATSKTTLFFFFFFNFLLCISNQFAIALVNMVLYSSNFRVRY